MLDRFRKSNLVDAPANAIGQDDPVGSLICCVVDSLLHVRILQVQSDCFDLDEELKASI